MKHRFWFVLTLLALGVQSSLFAQENTRKPTPESLPLPRSLDSELQYVPDDAVAVVHIRVAALLEKLKFKNRIDALLPVKMGWEQMFGVPLNEVEAVTVIGLPGAPGTMAFLVRTSKPFKESAVRKLYEHGQSTNTSIIHGKSCTINPDSKAGVCLLNTHTFLGASSSELLEMCLKQVTTSREDELLAAALKTVEKHDLSAWVAFERITGTSEVAMIPWGVETASVTLDLGEELTLNVRISCENDYAKEWTVKGLKTGIDLMRAQALMVLGMIDGTSLFGNLGGNGDDLTKQLQGLPLKLMRQVEKGFTQSKIQTEETTVTLNVTIPIDCKTLRGELLTSMRLMIGTTVGPNCDGGSCPPFGIALGGTYNAGMQLPTPQYLTPSEGFPISQELATQTLPPQAIGQVMNPTIATPVYLPSTFPPPQVVPASAVLPPPNRPTVPPSMSVPPNAQFLPTPTVATPSPIPTTPVPATIPVPPAQPGNVVSVAGQPYTVPLNGTIPIQAPPAAQATALPQPNTPWATPPVAPTTANPFTPTTLAPTPTQKMSIANVHKETAMLFTMSNDGKMTFMHKLPAGEAVDVQATVGHRWIAVFTDKPAGETKTIEAGEKVWLLR